MPLSAFIDQIHARKVLVADGATGTNLQKRGLAGGQPSEAWLFDHPKEIIRLHCDFLEAGADILLTNTFGASAIRLETAALGKGVEQVNIQAVDLARLAIATAAPARPIYIGGSMGPAGQLLKPYGPLGEYQVESSFTVQAKALAKGGVDFLCVETHFDIKEASLAVSAAKTTGLPVVVSFSYDRGVRTMMGVSAKAMAEAMQPLEADVLGVNCGRSLEENFIVLQELRQATSLPIWFKPNAGIPEVDEKGAAVYSITPQEMGALAPQWVKAGAQVVGGCCGTSPEHLREIARAVKN